MTDAHAIHELVSRHQSTGRSLLYRLAGPLDVEVEASGCWVTGASGRRYLDLGSYAVFLLGHAHPRVVAAVAAQLGRPPGSRRAFPSREQVEAAAALAAIAPEGLSKVMLLNSGAEAVEAALKLARLATGRTAVLHLEGSFHGKTTGALSLTDAALFRERCEPLLPGSSRLDRDDPEAAAASIRAARPAAVFVEPVQGEGGVFELRPDYLRAVRTACDEAGAVLVCDEIQCGLGRCGAVWASAPVVPDLLLAGKALGGGVMPVSALVARPAVFTSYDRDPLLHTSTFGGNPLAAAAALATLDVIVAEDVPARAREQGEGWRRLLEDLRARWPRRFSAVSGRGLLLGLHCARPDVAGTFIRSCRARGVLVTPCLTRPHVVRLTPPVCVSPADVEFAAEALEAAAAETDEEIGEPEEEGLHATRRSP